MLTLIERVGAGPHPPGPPPRLRRSESGSAASLGKPTRKQTTLRFANVEINPKLASDALDRKLPKAEVEVR